MWHVGGVQLNFTEKGLRKMMEMGKSIRQSLACEEVLDTFKVRSLHPEARNSLLNTIVQPVLTFVISLDFACSRRASRRLIAR